MIIPINQYVGFRTYHQLTQTDLAHLLCLKQSTGISRIEKGTQMFTVKQLLMLRIIFDLPVYSSHPFDEVELKSSIREHAATLLKHLQAQNKHRVKPQRKLFLESLISRLNESLN